MASNKDIVLTIKAQDNTQQAVATAVTSLLNLESSALSVGDSVQKAESQVNGFSKVLESFTAVSNKISQGSSDAATNIEKIDKAIVKASEDSSSRLTTMAELGVKIAEINKQIIASKDSGADKDSIAGLTGQLKLTESLYNNLAKAQERYGNESASLSASLAANKSALEAYGEMQKQVDLYVEKASVDLESSKNALTQNKEAVVAAAEAKKTQVEAEKAAIEAEKEAAQALAAENAETEKRVASLNRLKESLDPVEGKTRQLKEAQDILTASFEKGEISEKEFVSLNESLQESYEKTVRSIKGVTETHEEYIQRLKEEEAAEKEAATARQRNDNLTSLLGVSPNQLSSQQHADRASDLRSAFLGDPRENQALAAENAEIEKFKNNLNPLAAQIANLSSEQEKLDGWFMRGKISEEQYQEGSTKLSASIQALKDSQLGLADSSERTTQAQDKLTSAAQKWRDVLDPVAPVLRAAAQQEKELAELEKQGLLTTEQATAARKKLAEETERLAKLSGGRYKFSLFGLEGYETNNLMYQINDVISGFAMGQSPFQILAQQGGQVFQLFQTKLGPAFNWFKATLMSFGGMAAFAGISASLLSFYEILSRANEKIANFRRAIAFSSINVDVKSDDVQGIAQTERSLERLGVTGTDAMNAIAKAKELGLNTEAFTLVESAAKSLSIAFGVQLKDSVGELSKAFSGNITAIEDLNKKYNFLSEAQAKHIRDLVEEGDNQKAGSEALEIFNSKMSETATKMEGGWAFALRSFKEGWNDFWDSISNFFFLDTFIQKMEKASYETRKLKEALKGEGTSDSIQAQIDSVQKHLDTKGNGAWLWGAADEYNDKEQLRILNERKKEAKSVEDKAKAGRSTASSVALDEMVEKQNRELPASLSYDQYIKRYGRSGDYIHAANAKIAADMNRSFSSANIDAKDPKAQKMVEQAQHSEEMRRQKAVDDAASSAAHKRESEAKRAQQSADQYRKTQESLNLAVDSEIEKSKQNYDIREKTNNKTGTALILTKEEIELQNAQLELQKRVNQANINLKPGQKPFAISDEKMSEFTAAKQADMLSRDALPLRQAQMAEYDKPVKALEQQRERLTQLIQAYSALGQNGVVGDYEKQLLEVTQQLKEASDNSDKFYASIEAGGEESARSFGLTLEQVTNIRDGLQKNKEAGSQFGKEFLESGKAINEEWAGGVASSFTGFVSAIAQGNSALSALKQTFLSFANSFLTKIIEMIIKQTLFNAISGAGKGGTGEGGAGGGFMGSIAKIFGLGGSVGSSAIGGAASSAIPAAVSLPTAAEAMVPVLHGGGSVGGAGGLRRSIGLSVFNGARKFHDGTMPGLSKDEIPAILQKGEHVLTEAQQKSLSQSTQAKPQQSAVIKNVLVQHPSQLAQALSGSHGATVVLTHLANNAQEARAVLGIN